MKNYSKKVIVLAVTASLLILSVGCGNKEKSGTNTAQTQEQPKQIELRLGTVGTDDSHFGAGANKFKEEVEKRTNGQIKVSVFANSALGGERELMEGEMVGTVDMSVGTSGPLGTFYNEMNVFDLPYLFNSREEAFAVLDSPIGTGLAERFEKATGVKILGYMEGGFRAELNNVRPIKTVADMKNMKYRVVESAVQIDIFKAFGAAPTPMAFGEVYTSLKQGVIDGCVVPYPGLYTSKLHEVTKYNTYLQDMYTVVPITIAKKKFDSLTAEQQKIIVESAKIAVTYQREQCEIMRAGIIDKFKAAGIIVTIPADMSSFKNATKPVFDKWAEKVGVDLVNSIVNFKK